MSSQRSQVEPFGGVVLAGGKSSRMGRDKAHLPYGEKRLVDHMVRLLGAHGCVPVLISGKMDGYHCIEDRIASVGPLGGIHAVAEMAVQQGQPQAWLFVPVDMPLLPDKLLRRLTTCACEYNMDGACFTGRPLPLFLRLHERVRAALHGAAENMKSGKDMSVRQFLAGLRICQKDFSDAEAALLANANTPEEWQRIKAG